MLKVDYSTKIPSVSTTLGILRAHNELMPIFLDFDKLISYLSYVELKAERIREPLFEVLERPRNSAMSVQDHLRNWLKKTGNTTGFKTNTQGISLDKPSIASAIESEMLSIEAVMVLQSYQKYTGFLRASSTCKSFLKYPVLNILSYDGHRMISCVPSWEPQNTGRVAMNTPAIQNLPRWMQDLNTVPEGWVLLYTDSGQIEPRIIYSVYMKDPQIKALIELYNDAYFGLLHYVTMPIENISNKIMTFERMEITSDLKDRRTGIKTNCNAVMYGATSNVTGDPVKAALIERIGKHPLRKALVNEIEDSLDRGNTIFNTAFGTPIDISKSEKLVGVSDSKYLREELIKLAINNRVQGTAADLMRLSVSNANHIMSTRTKNSVILNYVHDAGRFAVHEDELHLIKDDLETITAYSVDGWINIDAEPKFGRVDGLFPDLF